MSTAVVVTEVQALAVPAGVRARVVGCRGVGGNEGAVIMLLEGSGEKLAAAVALVEAIKGEPNIQVLRHRLG